MSTLTLSPVAQATKTMSSREIAELTSKRHDHVIRDIRAMLTELRDAPDLGDGSDLSHVREDKDARGYTAMFHLDRELTDTLLTGYSAVARRKVVARWHELEAVVQSPRTPGELLVAQAQAFHAMELEQAAIKAGMARIESRVEDLAESRVWDHCPQNCEPITKIEKRMNERYALPAWVVDMVVRQLPLSPKPYGMVRNQREEANGSQYAVYAVADITRIFAHFVSECVQETPTRWSHKYIERSFQMLPGGRRPKLLKSHAKPMEPA